MLRKLILILFVSLNAYILRASQINIEQIVEEVKSFQEINSDKMLVRKIFRKEVCHCFNFEKMSSCNCDSIKGVKYELSYSNLNELIKINIKDGKIDIDLFMHYTKSNDTILYILTNNLTEGRSKLGLNSFIWKKNSKLIQFKQSRLESGFFNNGIKSISEIYFLDSSLVANKMLILSSCLNIMALAEFRYFKYLNDLEPQIMVSIYGMIKPKVISSEDTFSNILETINYVEKGIVLASNNSSIVKKPELKYYWIYNYDVWVNSYW